MKTTPKRPVILSLLFSITLIAVISVCTAVAMVNNANDTILIVAQAAAFLIMGVFFTLYMRRQDKSMAAFGFTRIQSQNAKAILFYLPLAAIAFVQPLMLGVNTALSPFFIALTTLQMIVVGYTEEVLFRGIFLALLHKRGKVFYVVFSSIIFGVLHVANGLSGNDMTLVLLQIINALLVGVMLALAYLYGKSIWPLIVFHTLYNFLAMISKETSVEKNITLVLVLCAFYTSYIAFMLIKNRGKKPAAK